MIEENMHVAMYYNNNDIRIEEMPVPEIGPDEFLVRVQASGVCGSDVMEWYRIKKAPCVLGHEITGDIVEVGKNVKSFHVGDRVFVSHHVPCNACTFCLNDQHTLCDTLHSTNFYPGGFAEYLKVPPVNVDRGTFLLSDELTYNDGVFIEPLSCVVRGLRIAEFQSGQSILIIGSGMAGLLHIKLARALGASRIIATDVEEFKLKVAQKIGADVIIHADNNIPQQVKKNNNGKLADFVVLCTSSLSAVRQTLESVAPGGTILFFAPTQPGVVVPFQLFDLWNKQVKMMSTYAGAPKDITTAIDLLTSKKVAVEDLITHKLPLTDAAKGFKLVADGTHSIKVILKPHT